MAENSQAGSGRLDERRLASSGFRLRNGRSACLFIADTSLMMERHSTDALLVIEVSDSSLHYDRNVKLLRYAQSGVPELWIVDLATRQIETFREPDEDRYDVRAVYWKADRIEIPGGDHILVDLILPSK